MVCVEVGKDFVDMFMGFFILFLSCMVRVLVEVNMIYWLNDEFKILLGFFVCVVVDMKKCKFEFNFYFVLIFLINIFESGENGV